jgi:hypothetical protein
MERLAARSSRFSRAVAPWAPLSVLAAASVVGTAPGCVTPTFPALDQPDAALAGGPEPTGQDVGGPWGMLDGGASVGGLSNGPPRDAAVDLPSLGLLDAQVQRTDANVPTWAAGIAGYYARRTITYGFDVNQRLFRIMTLLSLAVVAEDAQGEWTLTTEPCRIELAWPGAIGNPVDTGTPAASAVSIRQSIYFDDEATRTFHLGGAALRFGFDVDRVGTCPAGTLRSSFPDQTWLFLPPACRCTATPQALPSSADDCRLSDSDRDGEPGFTMVEKRSNGSVVRYRTAIEVACRSGIGSVARDGQLSLDEHVLAAGQCVSASLDGCTGTPVPSCEVSRTELAVLQGSAPSCSDVLAAGLEAFTTAPGAPGTCGAP